MFNLSNDSCILCHTQVPYLLDLHLFLNREIKNATESSNDEGKNKSHFTVVAITI